MGEGGQVLEVGGRISGMRGNCGRPPLPTKFVEQISFQEIEEREVKFPCLDLILIEFCASNS